MFTALTFIIHSPKNRNDSYKRILLKTAQKHEKQKF